MEGNASGTKGRHWSHEETLHLIEIWGEPSIQLKFDNMTRKDSLYKQIEQELQNRGSRRTVAQIKEKLHTLKAKYKEWSLKINKRGAGDLKVENAFPYYSAIDKVFGKRPANNPLNVSDSIILDEGTAVQDDSNAEAVLQEFESFNSLDSSTTPSEESDKPGPSLKRKKDKLERTLDSVVDRFFEREEVVLKKESETLLSMKETFEKRHKEDIELRISQMEFMKERTIREDERKDRMINLMEKF